MLLNGVFIILKETLRKRNKKISHSFRYLYLEEHIMDDGCLRLGKIKNNILESLPYKEENDRNIYLLSESLNEIVLKYPNSYLSKIEGMKNVISNPNYVSKKEKQIKFFKLCFKNGRFYLTTITIHKKERWMFKKLEAFSFPNKEEGVVKIGK